ncbi:MAG: family 16 glycoside hydrolase [Gillisia sp.]
MKKFSIYLSVIGIFFLHTSIFAQDDIPYKDLFNGKNLDGWEQIQGSATYKVKDGMIEGTTALNSPNSFLVTKKPYGDFILQLDFKVDEGLNSGIQIRSHSDKDYKDGIVHGYQVEIDPAKKKLYSENPPNYDSEGAIIPPNTQPRSWTGGIYEEKGRGWLFDLTHNEEARKAFKPGEWNHLRIEATGYRIYTWLNGVLAASLFDNSVSSGFIGLQVHATTEEKPMHVYWKNIKIQDLSENTAALNKSKQDLTKKRTNSRVKTSLNAYSFSRRLNHTDWDLFDMIDYAAEHGFDAVDLTGYFFPGFPDVPSDEYIYKIKRHAYKMGVEIGGTGVRNDFAIGDAKEREKDIQIVKNWVDVAEKLGAPVVRVFAGPKLKGYENSREEIYKYMAEALKECADYGAKHGVLIGVQNHGGFLKTADQTIKLLKMVDSDWIGADVDTGYFITDDPYEEIEKIMPYAVNFQVKESPFGVLSRIRIDMPRLLRIIDNSGYRGYLPIETLGDKVRKGEPHPPYPFRPYDAEKMVPFFLQELKQGIANEYGTCN